MSSATLAAVAGAIAVAIGVLCNFGFFLALDLKLFPLLTYKDHLETLIFFVPWVSLLMLIWKWQRDRPGRRKLVDAIGVVLAAVTAIGWLQRGELVAFPRVLSYLEGGLGFLAALLVLSYCAAVLIGVLLQEELSSTARAQALALPCLGILVFVLVLGNAWGHMSMHGSQFPYRVTLAGEGGSTDQTHPARLVRAIDAGYLLVFQDEPQQLTYARSESGRMISETVSH
jgi:hypothetical protein